MTTSEREIVVREALSWQGTPYHHVAAVKGVGCDCALGPLAIYRAALPGLPQIEPPKYVPQWHLHRGEELYLEYVRALGGKEVEAPQPGDFVLFRQGRLFSHGAIVTSWPQILHAVPLAGFIPADASLDSRLSKAPRMFFTFD